MPIFRFNKLIRDRLVEDYAYDGQKATYRTLSDAEYSEALKQKIAEEVMELDVTDRDAAIGELADVQQALDDLLTVLSVSPEQVEEKKQKKQDKKGGFAGRHFVETLELDESDPWVDYYRKDPVRFPEE